MLSDQKEQIYKTYSGLFRVGEELIDWTFKLMEGFNKKTILLTALAPHQRIFLFFFTRAVKTYSAIFYLCQEGYGQDVSTLLRSLLENLITSKYILTDPKRADQLTARFVDYKWVILKKQLSEEEPLMSQLSQGKKEAYLEKKKLILEGIEKFKKKYLITSDKALLTWSGKTIKDMAQAVDSLWKEEYESTFRLCSRFSHPSILGDKEYIIQKENQLIFTSVPSNVGILDNLKKSTKYKFEFLKDFNKLFQLNFGKELSVLEKMLNSPFQETLNDFEFTHMETKSRPSLNKNCVIQFQLSKSSLKGFSSNQNKTTPI